MFTRVHHVSYVVHSVEQMQDYLAKNFDLKPRRVDNLIAKGCKSILYLIGPTILEFFEPTTDATELARQLRETGPGITHVAWAVEGIDQVSQDLKGKGNKLVADGPWDSSFGYRTMSIEPVSSHSIFFQLAEGEVA